MNDEKKLARQDVAGKEITDTINRLADEVIGELCRTMGMNQFQAIGALYNLNIELINRLKTPRVVH